MKVEIWSDVICPFCYIGKRKLESALAQLPPRDRVEICWKSFQLQPDTKTDPARNALQHLAERKGWSMDFARQAAADISGRARDVGLTFNYDRTVVANTFDAHRLVHYASMLGKGDAMTEQLFKAYFTDGRNIADPAVLAELAVGAGLPGEGVKNVLASDGFADDVRRDIDDALQMGINGVPFFVFDNRYAVSGAQDTSVFLEALARALDEPAWVGDVLDFWFGKIGARHWFSRSAEVDAGIRERFLTLYERLAASDAAGVTGPRPLRAAVIVLDQFSRNMFRDSPRAFAADPLARRLARQIIEHGFDSGLAGEERLFVYLPFEHSEDRADQALSCELIERLGNDDWTQYALAHKAIIDRFGRFPHRNAVLGRTSTAEEIARLAEPMGSF
jgi:predicted DsbA family dithiol-disulfide isomerase/uncharacterized protein (DUF924 family)